MLICIAPGGMHPSGGKTLLARADGPCSAMASTDAKATKARTGSVRLGLSNHNHPGDIMTNHQTSARPSLAGWLLSGLVILALLADAAVNLFAPELLAANMQAEGFPITLAPTLGIMMLLCAVIYAIPRTAMLGAILITGFFGGAICVHVRLGEIGSPPQIICVLLAAMAWGGLYLRDARIRALMPLRSSTA